MNKQTTMIFYLLVFVLIFFFGFFSRDFFTKGKQLQEESFQDKGKERIDINTDSDAIIAQEDMSLNYEYLTNNNVCNLSFLEDLGNIIKENISGVIFSDFLIIKNLETGYSCFKIEETSARGNQDLAFISDYGEEHFVEDYLYDNDSKVIKNINLDSITEMKKYQTLGYSVQLAKVGKVFQGIFPNIVLADSQVIDIDTFKSYAILLVSDRGSNTLESYEVEEVGQNFSDMKQTKDSDAFLQCILDDSIMSQLWGDLKFTPQNVYKSFGFDYSQTVAGEKRLILNYIEQLIASYEVKKPLQNKCFRFSQEEK